MHASMPKVMQYAFPDARNAQLQHLRSIKGAVPEREQLTPTRRSKKNIEPGEHLLCFDFLYFMAVQEPFEWRRDYAPVWRAVGQHLHWTDRVEEIARSYLRKTFKLQDGAEIPPVRKALFFSGLTLIFDGAVHRYSRTSR